MVMSVDAGVESSSGASPFPQELVTVRLEMSPAEAERLRSLGGSAWISAQLAAATGAGGAAAPAGPEPASAYLVGLAQALFPLPVSGDAVRLVDALRKQGLLEAAVTHDDAPGGDGDRAIVVDITSLGRAEIERLRRMATAG